MWLLLGSQSSSRDLRTAPGISEQLLGSQSSSWDLRTAPRISEQLLGSQNSSWDLRTAPGISEQLQGSQNSSRDLRAAPGISEQLLGSQNSSRDLRAAPGISEQLQGSQNSSWDLRTAPGISGQLQGSQSSSRDLRAAPGISGQLQLCLQDRIPPAATSAQPLVLESPKCWVGSKGFGFPWPPPPHSVHLPTQVLGRPNPRNLSLGQNPETFLCSTLQVPASSPKGGDEGGVTAHPGSEQAILRGFVPKLCSSKAPTPPRGGSAPPPMFPPSPRSSSNPQRGRFGGGVPGDAEWGLPPGVMGKCYLGFICLVWFLGLFWGGGLLLVVAFLFCMLDSVRCLFSAWFGCGFLFSLALAWFLPWQGLCFCRSFSLS
ncbi:uncharacterized protein LOC115600285 isoform X2 [Calypte anna]|uniref:uncharacterized protein LOC115600285 isoform X1 n=1 Tax=Calypte anna TaxID=9244 RepID=UPI0011C3E264|nr:uncharacterized protein LOC115600285 isoform X1 [Calypte anna]XP_030324501.1 uncharacterized protein LOC115600285 isoform X2 [Calypte anna]